MGHITHHKDEGHGPVLTNVGAGCTVRLRLRMTDGGVALDWTDPRVRFGEVAVWSDARNGIIARPAFSFDPKDKTSLIVEHTTSPTDLPGLHRLIVNVSFMGWTAAHTVPAYNLVGGFHGGGARRPPLDAHANVAKADLEIRLHDISTTFLQRLIDHLLMLRGNENGRITALEIITEGLSTGMATLEECCGKVQETLKDLEDRVSALEKGGTTTPEPEQVDFSIEVTLEDEPTQTSSVDFEIGVELED